MVKREESVLLLVDLQADFLPGGSLAVPEGECILPPLRKLMESSKFGHYVATQDWHPPDHISFASHHPGARPMESVELYGRRQTLWPAHCVQGTSGAELHGALPWEKVAAIIRKGMDPEVDAYSGFRNNWNAEGRRPSTGLKGYLQDRGITRVFVCGLARDVCVRYTAIDAAAAGFATFLLWDLTRPVDPGSDRWLRKELDAHGVAVISMEELE